MLSTKAAFHAQDLDFLSIAAQGFPPAQGGILAWGDRYGLGKAIARMEELNKKLGFSMAFTPCQGLRDAAAKGPSFRLRDDIPSTRAPGGARTVSAWAPVRPGVSDAVLTTLLSAAAAHAFTTLTSSA